MRNLRQKKYRGNPLPGDGYHQFKTEPVYGTTWLVQTQKMDKIWRGVKVSAVGAVASKANYWLSWNGERWAKGKDLALIERHRPSLLSAVQGEVREVASELMAG
tara:strand:- start:922 stop:1233 length:312 start_codon:yes stop_codon:yes gene_type:complete